MRRVDDKRGDREIERAVKPLLIYIAFLLSRLQIVRYSSLSNGAYFLQEA